MQTESDKAGLNSVYQQDPLGSIGTRHFPIFIAKKVIFGCGYWTPGRLTVVTLAPVIWPISFKINQDATTKIIPKTA